MDDQTTIVITITDQSTKINVPHTGSINRDTYNRVIEVTHLCSTRRSWVLSLFLWLDIQLARLGDRLTRHPP